MFCFERGEVNMIATHSSLDISRSRELVDNLVGEILESTFEDA